MSIPLNILVSNTLCSVTHSNIFTEIAQPPDIKFLFNSIEEFDNYIRDDGASLGQFALVGKEIYAIDKIGDKYEYHKLQIEKDKIEIDEKGNPKR